MRAALTLIALIAGLAPVPASTLFNAQEERDLASWHLGPVRYVITADERAYFAGLDDDADRLAFVERFWKRRDPDPATEVNEYRATFWERVLSANERFTDSAYPGWKTDRGRIFILLGEPDEVEDHPDFDARDKQVVGRGLLRWHYRGLPITRSLDPETVVAFVRDNTGDFRLTADPELNDVYFDPLRPYDRAGLTRVQERPPLLARSEMATAMDLGRLQQVPTEELALRELVLTREFYGSIPAEVLVHRFPTGSSRPFVTLTLVLRKSDLRPAVPGEARALAERFRLVARLVSADGREELFGEDDFVVAPDPDPADGTVRFQARRSLDPGTYRLVLAAFDEEGGRAATLRADVVVEAYDPRAPALSDLVLASTLRDARGGQTAPFALGDLEVVPRGAGPLSARDRLRVYFQVLPPGAGGGPVRLAYRLERRPAEGEAFEVVGEPRTLQDQLGASTWDLPLADFPPGRYRITVEATAGDAVAVRTLEFDVTEEANPP